MLTPLIFPQAWPDQTLAVQQMLSSVRPNRGRITWTPWKNLYVREVMGIIKQFYVEDFKINKYCKLLVCSG